jgi:asparagine synthase (glutamine-hydrolysing)
LTPMCGICGVVRMNSPARVDEDVLRRMSDTLLHRGPDDGDVFLAGNVGLGHRRLSIIDLSGGHQPMANDDDSVWIVYNGEIYNFLELRAMLEAKGYSFKTKSDTEVILRSYEAFGGACVERLRGMFAFAIWDVREGRLFIARDRVGIKPLYYTVHDGTFLFASEIKALLQWPEVPREIDPVALRQYLQLRYVPGPRTMFRDIFKLQPGHTLTLSRGKITLHEYWDLPLDEAEASAGNDAVEHFRHLLDESVRMHLVSDVPLGVFLSGGLDSSTVVGSMAPLVDAIQTFSVGYPDGGPGSEMTEFAFARMVAERFGTIHRELELGPDLYWQSLDRLTWHFDEPVADPAAVPLYFLSKRARDFVTVVLSGEGADEMLAGYAIYQKMLTLERLRRIPGASLGAGLARHMPGRKLRRYLGALGRPLHQRYRGVSSLFSKEESHNLLVSELRVDAHDADLDELHFDRLADLDPLRQMLYFDMKVWLPDDLLVKADKMTMATSVELRVPFLDHRLLEYAWRLPSDLKLRAGTGKHLLRQAAAGRVPAPILSRSKLGFPVPTRGWFQGQLGGAARQLLLDRGGAFSRLFDAAQLEALLDRHERGAEDFGGEIYALVVLALWHRQFIASSSIATTPPSLSAPGDWV